MSPESPAFMPEAIRAQVERIAASDLFIDADSVTRLLRLIVEWDLTGKRANLTGREIGNAIFGALSRSVDDSVIRQNVRRLRERLENYYTGPGAHDPIRITIPIRGRGFRPVYESPVQPAPAPPPDPPVPQPRVWKRYVAAIAGLLVVMASVPSIRQLVLDIIGWLPTEKHLVVLPFGISGGGAMERAFSEGLREGLVAKLKQAESVEPALWVVPTEDVEREKVADVRAARRAFRATLVLRANFSVTNNRARVDLSVYNAETDRTLKRGYSEAAKLFEIQGPFEGKVVRMLRLSKDLDEPQSRSAVPDANTFYITGLGYIERGRDSADNAIGLFERALEADPDFALAHAGLARAFLLKRLVRPEPYLIDLAEKSCKTALQKSTGLALAPLHVTLGQIYYIKGLYKDAEQECGRALGIDPKDSLAYKHLGLAQEKLLKFEDAERNHGKAIALQPERWSGYLELGLYYYRRGRLADAESQLLAASERAPDNRVVYLDLSAVYIKQDAEPKAEEALKKCLAIRPDRPDADCINNRGNLLHYQGRHDEAADDFESSIQQVGPSALRLWNLSAAYRWSKNPARQAKARPTLESAIEHGVAELGRNPNDAELHARLALCYAHLDQTSTAINEIGAALKLDRNAVVLFQSVRVFERLGRRDDAIKFLRDLWAMSGGHIIREIKKDPDLAQFRKDHRYQEIESH